MQLQPDCACARARERLPRVQARAAAAATIRIRPLTPYPRLARRPSCPLCRRADAAHAAQVTGAQVAAAHRRRIGERRGPRSPPGASPLHACLRVGLACLSARQLPLHPRRPAPDPLLQVVLWALARLNHKVGEGLVTPDFVAQMVQQVRGWAAAGCALATGGGSGKGWDGRCVPSVHTACRCCGLECVPLCSAPTLLTTQWLDHHQGKPATMRHVSALLWACANLKCAGAGAGRWCAVLCCAGLAGTLATAAPTHGAPSPALGPPAQPAGTRCPRSSCSTSLLRWTPWRRGTR